MIVMIASTQKMIRVLTPIAVALFFIGSPSASCGRKCFCLPHIVWRLH
jgi:hypothetical protein